MANKKHRRRTQAEMADIRSEIWAVLKADHPMTVRQVFYQLVVRNAIEKTEESYKGTVIRLLTEMRMAGDIPFAWIVDESRRTRQTETFDNIVDALNSTATFYRRSALRESNVYIEIWCEKEALSGIVWDEAKEYDVPVVVSKGTPSITQIWNSFQNIYRAAKKANKQSYVYQFGDHDPSGHVIADTIESRLYGFCEEYDCQTVIFERVALSEQQIDLYRLPTRPTKRAGNNHAKNFRGDSTELDALPSHVLRDLVRSCIEQHISAAQVATLRAAEQSERTLIEQFAQKASEEMSEKDSTR